MAGVTVHRSPVMIFPIRVVYYVASGCKIVSVKQGVARFSNLMTSSH